MVVMAKDRQGAWYMLQRREAIRRGLEVMGVVSIGAFTLDRDQTKAVTHAVDTGAPNAEAVGAYRGILDALRRAEDRVGSAAGLRHAGEVHLDTLKGWLATTEPGSLFDDLARLTAEFSGSCGWMHYDAGNFRESVMVYRDALPFAQALKDRPLAAWMTRLTARSLSDLGDLAGAVRHAERAVSLLGGTDAWRVRAAVQAQRSEVHARLGDHDASRAALGKAEEAFDRADGADAPYAYFFRDVRGFRGRGL